MNPAVARIENLWNNILQCHDFNVYNHLQAMNVVPTTFALNWTRLLFSRQIPEYLTVWDSIFASNFSLIDYIVAAMVKLQN